MADIKQFLRNYKNYHSTFKNTSYDKHNGIYLCNDNSPHDIIDFDKIIASKYQGSKRPKSFDAIYIHNDKYLFLIEFKNQKPSNIDNDEVRKKLKIGINELFKLFSGLNIQKNNYKYIYCVVYQNCKEPYDRYKCGIAKEKILFGLERYEKKVDKVYTNSVDFFTRQFKKQFNRKLKC